MLNVEGGAANIRCAGCHDDTALRNNYMQVMFYYQGVSGECCDCIKDVM